MNQHNLENDYVSTEEMIENSTKGGFKQALSDENYNAQIVGIVSKMSKFIESGKEYRSYSFVFQMLDDDGKVTHVQSKQMTPSLSEKSTLRAYLQGWLKQSDPKAITEVLKSQNIISDKGFSFLGFMGKQCKITVNLKPSKKDASKLYPIVTAISPSKQDAVYTAVEATLSPKMLMFKEADSWKLLDIIKVVDKKAEAPQKPAVTSEEVEVEGDPSELPF